MSTQLKEGQIFTPKSRLGYPKLYRPVPYKNNPANKPRYGCQIMLPKSDTKTKAQFDAELERLVKTHLKGKMPKAADLFIKDGDGEDGDENSKGFWVISANRNESQGRPQIVDRDGRTPLHETDGKPYAGCWCNFLVSVYWSTTWGKICCGLEIVQFVKDDEPFGGSAPRAADVMPSLEDEDDDI
jgi:hypothetical protein